MAYAICHLFMGSSKTTLIVVLCFRQCHLFIDNSKNLTAFLCFCQCHLFIDNENHFVSEHHWCSALMLSPSSVYR